MADIARASLNEILEEKTPLTVDCGELCGKKCCSGESGRGVYLFPGEEKLFAGETAWCRLEELTPDEMHFTGGSHLLICRGICPRERRPLSCRLFPMMPRLDGNGNLDVVFDTDALFICPLVQLNDLKTLDPAFLEGVRRVWLELLEIQTVRAGLLENQVRLEGRAAEPWTRLLY